MIGIIQPNTHDLGGASKGTVQRHAGGNPGQSSVLLVHKLAQPGETVTFKKMFIVIFSETRSIVINIINDNSWLYLAFFPKTNQFHGLSVLFLDYVYLHG